MTANTLVGLDIGSTSIRAVEATPGRRRPVISNFGQTALQPGVVVGGVIHDDQAVTAALHELWSAHAFTSKQVVLGITHPQVMVREVDVADLPEPEFKQALPYLVRDVLPLAVEQALFDFFALGEPVDGTVHGLLIAVPRKPVLDTVHAVEAAGLTVAHVDLASFAALRASAHLASDTEALLNIGADATELVVHTDGTPKVVRTLARGGAEVTTLVAARLGISAEEAELVKRRVGLSTDKQTVSGEVIAEAIEPLIEDIRSSIDAFAARHPDQRVNRLALVGGAALLPGLPGLLRDALGVPTSLSDPLQRVSDARHDSRNDVLGRFRSSAAVSIGLTLGAA